jgi:hypothetical protein
MIQFLCSETVGVLLAVAGVAKLLNRQRFEASLRAFVSSQTKRALVAIALPWLELGIGLAIVTTVASQLQYAAGVLLVLFLIMTAKALLTSPDNAECGCFGVRSRLGVTHLLRSAAILTINVVGLGGDSRLVVVAVALAFVAASLPVPAAEPPTVGAPAA